MIRDRIKAFLEQDGDAEPQARDEEPILISREEHTEEPDRDQVEAWVEEFRQNPLLRVPILNFAHDVLEPGVEPTVDVPDDGTMPTVPNDYPIEEYRGMDLDAALAKWVGECYIAADSFDGDLADLMREEVKNLRGKRGSSLTELAYDDPEEREYLLGLRPFRVETVTAYTREGKAILMRPDDDPQATGFETRALGRDFDNLNDGAPKTVADKTAAFVQFDDIFGDFEERDDIPLALDDVVFISHNADTGQVFGWPDTAVVSEQAKHVREQFDTLDRAIDLQTVGQWIATVDTNDEQEARDLLNGVDPRDTDSPINVTNYAVELEQVFGDVPDVTANIQQEIEYILSAFPTPLFIVGFASEINRDVTPEQRAEYQQLISSERDRLETQFRTVVRQKAKDFLFQDAKSDEALPVEVGLSIEPDPSESPLEDDEFDADEFSSVMQGLKAAAPGGAVEQVVPPHEVREKFLGLDPDPPEAPDSEMPLPEINEANSDVQEAFADAYLATRYSEGDEVETPNGVGVVVDVFTEDDTFAGTAIEASDSSPTYIVATEGGRPAWEDYSASDLQQTTIDVDGVDPVDAAADAEAMADLAAATEDAELSVTDWSYPESWQDSPTPNRVILLKAWAGMGGSFDGCQREMRGNIGRTAPFCASMKDRVLLTEDWRE